MYCFIFLFAGLLDYYVGRAGLYVQDLCLCECLITMQGLNLICMTFRVILIAAILLLLWKEYNIHFPFVVA